MARAGTDEGTLTLGLIGGLGLAAGIHYYRRLVNSLEEREETPRLLLAHADLRRVLEHVAARELPELTHYLCGIVRSLSEAGADVAAISAVTPHVCITELANASPIPIVNILDVVRAELDSRGLQRIALLGTRYVIESELFGSLSGFDVVTPTASETSVIDSVYRELALRGHGVPGDRESLSRIALDLCERERLDAVVLAGTDLSVLFDSEDPAFPSVDCSLVHIRAIAERL